MTMFTVTVNYHISIPVYCKEFFNLCGICEDDHPTGIFSWFSPCRTNLLKLCSYLLVKWTPKLIRTIWVNLIGLWSKNAIHHVNIAQELGVQSFLVHLITFGCVWGTITRGSQTGHNGDTHRSVYSLCFCYFVTLAIRSHSSSTWTTQNEKRKQQHDLKEKYFIAQKRKIEFYSCFQLS